MSCASVKARILEPESQRGGANFLVARLHIPLVRETSAEAMDKLKGVTKNGWKPGGDRPIHRDSWKSDLKGMATGKKKDPYEYARDHQSAPLTTLKDPDSFGPPPKHREFYPDGQSPSTTHQPGRWTANGGAGVGAASSSRPSGGLGSVVPVKTSQQREQEAAQQKEEEDTVKKPSGPFQIDSSGLRTDHLPKPPARRNGPDGAAAVASPSVPSRTAAPVSVPARNNSPSLPPRQTTKPGAPPPILPPRQNEYPDEHTPAPPPPYSEAEPPSSQPAGFTNQHALNRLGQAGVSVPGLDIGGHTGTSSPAAATPTAQVNELQQRFAQMNAGAGPQVPHAASSPIALSGSAAAEAAAKKGPPPPPPKKSGLVASLSDESSRVAAQPPPVPTASKPRPT